MLSKIVSCKNTEKKQLENPRRTWDDNVRMDLDEIGVNTRNWLD